MVPLDPRAAGFHRSQNNRGMTMTVRRIAGLTLGAALAGLALAATVQPGAAGPVERMFTRYHGIIPACDNPWALGTIWARFAYKEIRFWSSSNFVHGFEDVREIDYRPWGPNAIPRRYCEAKVRVNDKEDTVVRYWIGEGTGFAGAGWGVEFCVVGYDRNLAYAPRCKMAAP